MSKHDEPSEVISAPAPLPEAAAASPPEDGDRPPAAPSSPSPASQHPPQNLPKAPRRFDPETGLPLGPGGPRCSWCGEKHRQRTPCDEPGLRRKGWTLSGKTAFGKPRWLNPETSARNARRQRQRSRGVSSKRREGAVANLVEARSGIKPEAFRAAVERAEKAAASLSWIETLSPVTQRVWITTAKARLGGLSEMQIAEVAEIEPALVKRLTASPAFILFESEFRRVMLDGDDMRALQVRALMLMSKAMDAAEHWVVQRGAEGSGLSKAAAASASLTAAREIASWVGFGGTKAAARLTKVTRDLPDGRVETLLEAVVKVGA